MGNGNHIQTQCIIVDDEQMERDVVRRYIQKIPTLKLIGEFGNAIDATIYLQDQSVDIIFLDIKMPQLSGTEFVRSLRNMPKIIFTTAHKEFAHEGFELDAIDYLLKPISFERFSRAVHKAIEYHDYKTRPRYDAEESLFIYSEYRMMKISLQDIEYIESLEDYIKIHRTNDKPVLTLMTLKAVLEKLPSHKFRRIHRSYIVAVDKVRSILNRKVTLASSTELPVSDSYLSFINEWKKHS